MTTNRNIRVLAFFKAKPGKAAALKDFLSQLVEPTRREDGCLRYELHQNKADPEDIVFIEEWASDAALDDHLASAHVLAALPMVGEFVSASPDIRRYRLLA